MEIGGVILHIYKVQRTGLHSSIPSQTVTMSAAYIGVRNRKQPTVPPYRLVVRLGYARPNA